MRETLYPHQMNNVPKNDLGLRANMSSNPSLNGFLYLCVYTSDASGADVMVTVKTSYFLTLLDPITTYLESVTEKQVVEEPE
jgi:hypothetical protein